MNLNLLKENILETKLNLLRIQLEKQTAIKNLQYEKAANLREQEKQIREHIENQKSVVVKSIHTLKVEHGSIADFILLQALLLEFHSNDFLYDCSDTQSIEVIDNYMNCYWRIREQMQDDLMKFLCDEYQYLRVQIRNFTNKSDSVNAQVATSRLTSISDIINRHSN